MAYHQAYEVIMSPVHASGALATTFGGEALLANATTVNVAVWAPGYVPHKVHGCSIVMTSNVALGSLMQMQFQHTRPFTGTRIRFTTLTANRKVTTVADTAETTKIHQTFDAHGNFTTQIAFNSKFTNFSTNDV